MLLVTKCRGLHRCSILPPLDRLIPHPVERWCHTAVAPPAAPSQAASPTRPLASPARPAALPSSTAATRAPTIAASSCQDTTSPSATTQAPKLTLASAHAPTPPALSTAAPAALPTPTTHTRCCAHIRRPMRLLS